MLNLAYLATNDDRIRLLRGIPNELHGNYYRRKRHLDGDMVGRDLDSTAESLDLLTAIGRMKGRIRQRGPGSWQISC